MIVDLSSHAGQLTRMIQDAIGDTLHVSTEGPGVMGQQKRRWIMVEPSKEALNRDGDETFVCEWRRAERGRAWKIVVGASRASPYMTS